MEGLVISELQQAGYRRHDRHESPHAQTLEKLKQDYPGVDEPLLLDILRGYSYVMF